MSENNLVTYALREVPYYHCYGRTDREVEPMPLFWNGSGIEVTVTGAELWIDLEVDYGTAEPWMAMELNGAFISRQMLQRGVQSVCLFRNMSPELPKTVKFFRETQPMGDDERNHVRVCGFQSDGAFLPVRKHDYRLEFIGDSITSGEGSYGAHDDMDWLPMYMSSTRNYATFTARNLNADYHLISQGGWGVLCGWDNDVRHNLPEYYERTCGMAVGETNEKMGAQKKYDFASWQPDAIIVNLGTNDASAFSQPAWVNPQTGETFVQHRNADGSYVEEDLKRFKQAVCHFLRMLRRNNPHAHIVWTYGMLGYDLNLAITDAINCYQSESGDRNVAFVTLPAMNEQTVGSHAHPGLKCHQRAAEVLTDYLKGILPKRA